jgi:hypothetical protein
MIHIVEMFLFAMSKNSKASKHFYQNRERRNAKMKTSKCRYTGWPKSFAPTIEYLHYDPSKRADFLSMLEPCSSFVSIKTRLDRSFVKYHH